MSSHRRHIDEHDDFYEPSIKRPTSRKTTTDKEQETLSKGSVKRTSTGARVSSNTSAIVYSSISYSSFRSFIFYLVKTNIIFKFRNNFSN
jgi:hypothetical protein